MSRARGIGDGGGYGGGALLVSGGSTVVVTEELRRDAVLLDDFSRAAVSWAVGVRLAVGLSRGAVDRVDEHAESLAIGCEAFAAQSSELSRALGLAADNYEDAEARTTTLLRGVHAGIRDAVVDRLRDVAPPFSSFAPGLLPLAGAIGSAVLSRLREEGPDSSGPLDPRILRDPAVLAALRGAISSLDDAALTAAGVPAAVSRFFGDEDVGVLGVSAVGTVVLGLLSRVGMLPAGSAAGEYRAREIVLESLAPRGGVVGSTVVPGRRSSVDAPTTVVELLSRIPRAVEGGPQVRIERYDDRAIVYVAGTVATRLDGAGEPFDLGSALGIVAERDTPSVQAVRRAMTEAELPLDLPIVLVGHSQGGLIAARIAQEAEYDVSAVLTVGSPVAALDMPESVPLLSIEHSDDLVPALAGTGRSDGSEPQRVTISRRAIDPASVDPDPFAAHALTAYRETAALVDGLGDGRIAAFASAAALGAAGAAGAAGRAGAGSASLWRVDQVPVSRDPAVSGARGTAAAGSRR